MSFSLHRFIIEWVHWSSLTQQIAVEQSEKDLAKALKLLRSNSYGSSGFSSAAFTFLRRPPYTQYRHPKVTWLFSKGARSRSFGSKQTWLIWNNTDAFSAFAEIFRLAACFSSKNTLSGFEWDGRFLTYPLTLTFIWKLKVQPLGYNLFLVHCGGNFQAKTICLCERVLSTLEWIWQSVQTEKHRKVLSSNCYNKNLKHSVNRCGHQAKQYRL